MPCVLLLLALCCLASPLPSSSALPQSPSSISANEKRRLAAKALLEGVGDVDAVESFLGMLALASGVSSSDGGVPGPEGAALHARIFAAPGELEALMRVGQESRAKTLCVLGFGGGFEAAVLASAMPLLNNFVLIESAASLAPFAATYWRSAELFADLFSVRADTYASFHGSAPRIAVLANLSSSAWEEAHAAALSATPCELVLVGASFPLLADPAVAHATGLAQLLFALQRTEAGSFVVVRGGGGGGGGGGAGERGEEEGAVWRHLTSGVSPSIVPCSASQINGYSVQDRGGLSLGFVAGPSPLPDILPHSELHGPGGSVDQVAARLALVCAPPRPLSWLRGTHAQLSRAMYRHTLAVGRGTGEGHTGQLPLQTRAYAALGRLARARTLCEIGFNAGHSAASLLQGSQFLDAMVVFDLAEHPYVQDALGALQAAWNFSSNARGVLRPRDAGAAEAAASGGRQTVDISAAAATVKPLVSEEAKAPRSPIILFAAGDSVVQVPYVFSRPPHPLCDIFHVDGGHVGDTPSIDLQHAIRHTRKGGLIVMDDVLPIDTPWENTTTVNGYPYSSKPTDAWEAAVEAGQVLEIDRKTIMGRKGWAAGLIPL